MSDTFKLVDNSATVIARLEEIAGAVTNMRPAFAGIGEALADSTKDRFSSSTAPDGSRWAPNAEATVLGHLAKVAGSYSKKTGKLTKKGIGAAMSKKPLVDTGILQDTITWQADATSVEIGTNRFSGEWEGGAAVHQFGSRDGSIPARPFLGISVQDETTVLEILSEYLRISTGAE